MLLECCCHRTGYVFTSDPLLIPHCALNLVHQMGWNVIRRLTLLLSMIIQCFVMCFDLHIYNIDQMPTNPHKCCKNLVLLGCDHVTTDIKYTQQCTINNHCFQVPKYHSEVP